MDGFSITIEGHEELSSKLIQLEPKMSRKILRNAFKEVGAVIEAAAKANAPNGSTGNLKSSIVAKVSVTKSKVAVTIGSVAGFYKGDKFYLAFNELGTRHQPAKPFLRPALETRKAEVISMVTDAIIKGLAEVES